MTETAIFIAAKWFIGYTVSKKKLANFLLMNQNMTPEKFNIDVKTWTKPSRQSLAMYLIT